MKVKEYLVNRILELERELKQARNEYAGVSYELSRRDNVINEQKKLIDDFQIEREHIKEIITCNIGYDAYNHLALNIDIGNNDFKTLLSILDIKTEDCMVEEVTTDAETTD